MIKTLALSRTLFATLFFIMLALPGFAEIIKIENPRALPVLDTADLLTQDQETSISKALLNLAKTDSTQMVVLTVPTTGDEDIFSFAQRTATDWGIGQKDKGNGVLMVVASQDKKVRIQVGYGLEGRLTDALSKRIIEWEILPEFRKGDWNGGISNGVTAIIQAVRGEYKGKPGQSHSGGGGFGWIFPFLMFIFIVIMIARGGRGGRGGPGGGGGLGWFILAMLLSGGRGGSGWTSGGGGSSWGGGGGGGFGGGFGGGGFGGGGASGGW